MSRPRTNSQQAKANPNVRGLWISVSGRFKITKNSIEKIKARLGRGYVENYPNRGKFHRFRIAATSFTELDPTSAMQERVEIQHCEDDQYHFSYQQRNGPKTKKGEEYLDFPYDEDVKNVIEILSASHTKKNLQISIDLAPIRFSSSALKELKFGDVRIGEVKLLLDEKRDGDILSLDWRDMKTLRVRLSVRRVLEISTDWPASLTSYLGPATSVLKRLGIEYGTTDRRGN